MSCQTLRTTGRWPVPEPVVQIFIFFLYCIFMFQVVKIYSQHWSPVLQGHEQTQ